MDQASSSKKKQLPTHHVFIKRTLHWLLPFTFASFLISMTSTFSVCFHHCFSTLVLPILAHAFERKYMFLICNGILAFLAKTLNLDSNDSSSSSAASTLQLIPVSDHYDHQQQQQQEKEEDQPEAAAEGFPTYTENAGEHVQAISGDENDEAGRSGELIMFGSDHQMVMDDEDGEMEEEEDGSGVEGLLLGGGGEKEDGLVNMNTEELNQKFEEFIRKMKEDLRIQETQKLITAA